MYSNIFDSHAHYDDDRFNDDRLELVGSLPSKGITGVVNCASNMKSARMSVALARMFDFVYAAVGIHPHDAEDARDSDIDELKTLLEMEKVVAVGEIGLDYHYDFSPRDVQLKWFEKQLRLAKEFDVPVIIHDREAHGDTLKLLKKYQPKGVVHCFSGSVEMASDIVKLGMYIGLGGAVTFKNAKTPAAVAASVPDDRILIETDAPYMTPVPHRGERCDSSYIPFTAEVIASVRGAGAQEILDMTDKNARELFSI